MAKERREYARRHFLIPLKQSDRIDMLKNQGYEIIFDPSGDGSCQFSATAYFFCSSGFDCSANQLREEVFDYLKAHRKNEEGQHNELFAGIPWSSYLNEMRLNGTFGDHVTLDAILRMYNVHIQAISSLGPQATVNINQENGIEAMVLGHYAEGQGDNYICLRSTPNFNCSEYEYDEPISDTDNIQTELDEHNSDMDNIQAELDECITDIGDARTELMGDMDNVQNELDKYISDNKSNWNLLPNEIWLKIIRAVLQQSDFKANHICFTFATLNLVNKRFNELTQKCKDNLPRIYCNPELFPKPKSGKHIVSIQSLIRKFGSFSGIVLEIKRIVNFSHWNSLF